ncbi:MAG: NAD(P)/FAD-dependent oxidoreductase [Actinobacteria bacterium]|nr:NAD(P)/FAD-dependent oxidoreductase [Actinomycetota bacterium]
MSADVIVVGAGYGGLTAGAILANNGLEVEVHEMTGHIGGRATFDRKDGFLVDYGIHANRFADEGAAAEALREIGHEMEFLPPGKPRIHKDGCFADFPTSPSRFLTEKSLSFSNRVLSAAGLLKLASANEEKSNDKVIRDLILGKDRPQIERLFETLCGVCIVSPDIDDTSAGVMSAFLKKALKAKDNTGYPRRGTSQIIGALESKIRESGRIVTNSRVKGLFESAGTLRGANVRDEKIESRAIVLAVPAGRTAELLKDIMPAGYLETHSSITPTAGISIDLCLRRKVSDIDGLIITDSPFTVGQFTSNIDIDTAPEGKQLATWLYPLPVEVMHNRDLVEAEEIRMRAVIESMFDGIMSQVEWERTLRLNMIDGFVPRPGQTLKDRPKVENPHIPNLFHAGDSISAPGTGGDVAFSSGVAAAGKVMEYLK